MIRIPYPSAEEEVEILARYDQGFELRRLDEIPLIPWIRLCLRARAANSRTESRAGALLLRRELDPPHARLAVHFAWRSPRAAIGLFHAARVLAGMDGRDYLLPDDVKAAALPVLRHRIS